MRRSKVTVTQTLQSECARETSHNANGKTKTQTVQEHSIYAPSSTHGWKLN